MKAQARQCLTKAELEGQGTGQGGVVGSKTGGGARGSSGLGRAGAQKH